MKRHLGRLVIFEGLDKSGKTTLAKKLAASLPDAVYRKGIAGPTFLGRLARRIPSTAFFLLELLADSWHLRRLRRRGRTVLLDRSLISVACHRPLADRPANRFLVRLAGLILPRPDILVFVTVAPDERKRRMRRDARPNPHERWLLDHPEWIGYRDAAYRRYYHEFTGRKLVLDTTVEPACVTHLKLRSFLSA